LSCSIFLRKNPKQNSHWKKALKLKRKGSGGGGESEDHRLLKEFIASNPAEILCEEGLKTLHIEYPFVAADKADLVLEDIYGRVIGLEVEVSTERDQIEGVLQAITYRFMFALVKKLRYEQSRAFLVAYSLAPEIKKVCRDYEIEFFEVDLSDVERWAKQNSI
jgi:RecB family endonuclease NucS